MDPLVLELLFENFDVTLLKSCRLVCKEWYEASLAEWRKRAVVCIGNANGSPLKPPCDRIPDRAKFSLRKWNKVWAKKNEGDLLMLREVPFRCFKIRDWSKWGVAETVFMKQTGSLLRQVDFMDCDFTEQSRGFSWSQFIRKATDIRELTLPNIPLSTFINILEAMEGIRSGDKGKFKLRRLGLSIGTTKTKTMPQDVQRIVQEMKWPLKGVSIELKENCDLDEIILSAYRNTLQKIKVCAPNKSPEWLSYNVFPFLKTLELMWIDEGPKILLTFLKRMPNLKELILKTAFCDLVSDSLYDWIVPATVDNDPEMATFTFPNITSAHFTSFGEGIFDPLSVSQIITWMPNLKRLTIPVDGSCLSIIFENLKQLEELKTLVFSTDNIEDFETFFTGFSSIPNEEGIHEKVSPGISDLTNLKTFSFLQPLPFQNIWTIFCFSYGFLRMPRLQNLFITVLDDEQFSEEMRSIITSTFPRGVIKHPKNQFGIFGETLCEYFHNYVEVNSDVSKCCCVCINRCANCNSN